MSSGAALAIKAHASEELKATYLAKINSRVVRHHEPDRVRAARPGAGKNPSRARGDHYRIFGQKIYITWGDHDATENIVHLVLPDCPMPAGSKGISLDVPKYLESGWQPGGAQRRPSGFHRAQTGHPWQPHLRQVYGDNDGAIGYLVGEENNGLACMFTMMNESPERGCRVSVLPKALPKGRGLCPGAGAGGVAIIEHADVKRMLTTMRALIEAMRALAYTEAVTMDLAHYGRARTRTVVAST